MLELSSRSEIWLVSGQHCCWGTRQISERHVSVNYQTLDFETLQDPAKNIYQILKWTPGSWFNKKMTSYQYRKSHCGDKTILRLSYLHSGISILVRCHLNIESGPRALAMELRLFCGDPWMCITKIWLVLFQWKYFWKSTCCIMFYTVFLVLVSWFN